MQPTTGTVAGNAVGVKRAVWGDALLVFALSFVYLRLLPDCFSVFDEGILAAAAERLMRGDLLYRDVFGHWAPGGVWLAVALFRVAGMTVHTLRLSLALFGAAAATAVWRLARDHAGRGLAVVAGMAVPLLCYPIWWMASPHWYSTFAALATALALRRSIAAGHAAPALCITGLLSGATYVIFQPVGLFLTAAIGVALVWDVAWTESVAAAPRRLGLFAVGALLPVVGMYVYFAAHGALREMIDDTFLWNVQHYRSAFQAPYGGMTLGLPKDLSLRAARALLMGLPAVYVWALLASTRRYVRHTARPEDRRLLAAAAVGTGVLAGNYYYLDIVHLAFAAPPAFSLLAALLSRAGVSSLQRWIARAAAVLVLGIVAAAGVDAMQRQRTACSAQLPTARGTIAVMPGVADDLRALLAFADSLPPGEPFFVYPYAPGYYFLTGHPNPTRYDYLFPYLPGANSEQQLAEVVAALERQQTRYVVLSLLWGRSMLSRYDTAVERYIRAHYHIAQEFPRTVVLERDAPGIPGAKIDRAP